MSDHRKLWNAAEADLEAIKAVLASQYTYFKKVRLIQEIIDNPTQLVKP